MLIHQKQQFNPWNKHNELILPPLLNAALIIPCLALSSTLFIGVRATRPDTTMRFLIENVSDIHYLFIIDNVHVIILKNLSCYKIS